MIQFNQLRIQVHQILFNHMYQHFEIAFLLQKPSQRSHRLADPYAVQPWEKNTLELEIQQNSKKKNYKTFYQTPSRPLTNANYITQREFSFTKQHQFRTKSLRKPTIHKNQDQISLGNASQKSMISHYNINGNLLAGQPLKETRKFSNPFFLRRSKEKKDKKRQIIKRQKQSEIIGISSLNQIKKRVNYVRSNTPKEDQSPKKVNRKNEEQMVESLHCAPMLKEKRKTKVISLGFRKISDTRGFLKQKSLNLQIFPFL